MIRPPHILIIGGGTGGALAHDLALRGLRVTVLERGQLLSGTTGRHHGLLHSGARYALHDVETAAECLHENRILRRIVPEAIEPNDGLFVALNDDDLAHWDPFLAACRMAGIPTRRLTAARALQLEPALNPDLKAAVQVPDASMDAWRLALPFFATARANGAAIRPFTEVIDIRTDGRRVTGVVARDRRTESGATIAADLVVNAAGPWAGKVVQMVGCQVPMRPSPGVMVAVAGRCTHMVVNRLQPAGQGDIIVPQRNLSILGTTAWLADDPDTVTVPRDHPARLQRMCGRLVPLVACQPPHAVWTASRPLLQAAGGDRDPMRIRRAFGCLDHAQRDGIEGLVTVTGGKATTLRAMAEKTADLICRKTGWTAACRTREARLRPYRSYFGKQ